MFDRQSRTWMLMVGSGAAILLFSWAPQVDTLDVAAPPWPMSAAWPGCEEFQPNVERYTTELCAVWQQRGPGDRFGWDEPLAPAPFAGDVPPADSEWILVSTHSVQVGPQTIELQDLSELGVSDVVVAFAADLSVDRARATFDALAAGGATNVHLILGVAPPFPVSPPHPERVARLVAVAQTASALPADPGTRTLTVPGLTAYNVTIPPGQTVDKWGIASEWGGQHGGRCPDVSGWWPTRWHSDTCSEWAATVSASVTACGCTPDATSVLDELAVMMIPVRSSTDLDGRASVTAIEVTLQAGEQNPLSGRWDLALYDALKEGRVTVSSVSARSGPADSY